MRFDCPIDRARFGTRSILLLLGLLVLLQPSVARGARRETLMPQVGVTKAPAPKKINWTKITREATQLLSKYIQIDTAGPKANEAQAANLLKHKFLSDGIPATIWQSAPGRDIVAARLRGIGRKRRTLILLSHMDVAPANPKHWKVPPFSGAIKDGYVWGRGALDGKGPGVIELMAMLAIKRSDLLLDRDVLFVATGDKHQGGRLGAQWFANNEKDIYSDAGYLIGQGGGVITGPHGAVYAVSVTEKSPLWIRLVTTGQAGSASNPASETSVTRLIGALSRLIQYQPNIHVLNPVEDYMRAVAKVDKGPKEWLNLANSLRDPAFAKKFVAVPYLNALVRDTITPTVLMGSSRTDMVPPTAYADVDCRLMPGQTPKAFLNTITKVIADKSIKIEVRLSIPPTSSPQRSSLMQAIKTLAQREKSHTVPIMSTNFSNCPFFRLHKIVSYGFIPLDISAPQPADIDSPNERVGVKALGNAIRRMTTLLKIFGGRG